MKGKEKSRTSKDNTERQTQIQKNIGNRSKTTQKQRKSKKHKEPLRKTIGNQRVPKRNM